MATSIHEFFGYAPSDHSASASSAAAQLHCPFIGRKCSKELSDGKVAGVCSLKPVRSSAVICCPIRLYADRYSVLKHIASIVFGPNERLVRGDEAKAIAQHRASTVVAVFGKAWGGELRLPRRGSGNGAFSVDWVLAKVSPDGDIQNFTAVEVQTIDTTGNYRNGIAALERDRTVVATTAGLNWENVNKRILPQLIYKGQVLEREPKNTHGLFFVSPSAVFGNVMERLGGRDRIDPYPMRGDSLNFLQWDYVQDENTATPFLLGPAGLFTTSVGTVWQAFHGTAQLPPAGAYESAIRAALSSGIRGGGLDAALASELADEADPT